MPPPAADADALGDTVPIGGAPPRWALRGRIVTLDAHDTVLADGVLYVIGRLIEAVRPAQAPAPRGFEGVTPIDTGGTVYPGLIDLHNHLPYDVLPLWAVPKRYGNRAQWGGGRNPAYRTLVTGPMTVLGSDPQLMPAVVRYVEVKALVNGATASQGIALFSNAGARRMYRGVLRNVEATGEPDLPEAMSRIADVEAGDARRFLARLRQPHRLLLHLAEGVDNAARAHFQALEVTRGRWAITENLVAIHCTALTAEDFQVLADHGGSMVWSPLSNLLLYGRTADIAAARQAGVSMALGSDWSVSGSKGLLGELKAARLASAAAGGACTDLELVSMATRNAARILRWDDALGALRSGLRADLLVVAGADGDPYASLIDAQDEDIRLMVIDGVARYGTRPLMRRLAPDAALEASVPGLPGGRVLHLADDRADPVVAGLTLAKAADRLSRALADLPALASEARRAPLSGMPEPGESVRWRLALDELGPTGAELRPRLPLPTAAPTAGRARRTGPEVRFEAPAFDGLAPLALGGLTASGDRDFLTTLAAEGNLPDGFGAGLARLLS